MKKIALLLLLLVALATCAAQTPKASEKDFIIKHAYYCVSYDTIGNSPRYTFHKLYKTNLLKPKVSRQEYFTKDPSWQSGPSGDMSFKPYDRGHMVPFDDMAWDSAAAKETFYMTNVVPQDAEVNRGVWQLIEGRARKLATDNDSAYVTTASVCGFSTIRSKKMEVCIPSAMYKVIFYYSKGSWKSECYMAKNTHAPEVVGKKKPKVKLDDYKVDLSVITSTLGLKFF
jgi:endonuclease G